ncbi:MAG: type I DNA topoisomerase [Desulfovibrionaceae bacterium]|nr:type I DNA topoisomerase [Desulfovibrionaceae bacterium]MBF0515105.1 type I DNA topoisomerase [Desulfovibrionaceae bacterium]
MKLMIVESPGKVKKIRALLGSQWRVEASVGHVRDLPVKDLGVDLQSFRPVYQPTERGKGVLSKLMGAVRTADMVVLATDPDREGEAIAWHLADALRLQMPLRATFAEITQGAVAQALEHPREIDMNLVKAQEARRVLDRLVGYKVSRPLSNVIGGNKTAGRVQSPALRLVVDRERAISSFQVVTHFGVELTFDAFDNITPGWKASWQVKAFLEPGQEHILDKALAEDVAGTRRVTVLACRDEESRKAPAPPFTTSSLQQAASSVLKLSPKLTMQLAQSLYEAGHITYMRTDSPNLSDEAAAAILEFCRSQGLPAVATPRKWKSKANAQEAHEAIRPTHIEVEEAGETEKMRALYALIRQRTLAACLEDAVFSVRTVALKGDELRGRPVEFMAKGRSLKKPGWKQVMNTVAEEEDTEGEIQNPVPALQAGSQLNVGKGVVVTRQTQPPSRFTEASLVNAMEGCGIGRPSTYAKILESIQERGYVRLEKRFLVPTADGEAVIDALLGKFTFLNYDYTAVLEDSLDNLAVGRVTYIDVVRPAFADLMAEVDAFNASNEIPCPECGKPLRHIQKAPGKGGKGGYDFWGCSGYPDCKASFANENAKPGNRKEAGAKTSALSEHKCPDCGKPLAHRVKDGKGGYNFWGCSGYPGCKVNFNDDNGQPAI